MTTPIDHLVALSEVLKREGSAEALRAEPKIWAAETDDGRRALVESLDREERAAVRESLDEILGLGSAATHPELHELRELLRDRERR